MAVATTEQKMEEEEFQIEVEKGSEVIMFKWGSLQKPFRCQLCDMLFEDGGKLKEHIDKHLVNTQPSTKPFQCKICPKAFLSNKSLERHTQMHYGQVQKRCKFCYKIFANKENLERHILTHNGQKPHKCPQCPEQFIYRQGLETHMATHSGVRPFVCAVCDRGFNRKDILERHMDTHEPTRKKYKCVECDKLFSHSFVLKRHTRAVHSEEFSASECPECKKVIKCKENMVRHMEIHTGERRYSCEVCGRKFRQKQHVADHMVVHTGGKPHKCDFCQESFKHKRTLTRHLRKHDEFRPHVCPKCFVGFPEMSLLKKHMKKHEEKQYQCTQCRLLFKLRSSLRRHKQKVHNEDISDSELDQAEGREFEVSMESPKTGGGGEKKIVVVMLKKGENDKITTEHVQAMTQTDGNNQIFLQSVDTGQKFELVCDNNKTSADKSVSTTGESIATTAEKISSQVAMETEVRMAAGQEFEEAMEEERSNIIQSLIEYAEREMLEAKQKDLEPGSSDATPSVLVPGQNGGEAKTNATPRMIIENIAYKRGDGTTVDTTKLTGSQSNDEITQSTQAILEEENQSTTYYLEESQDVEEAQTIILNSGDNQSAEIQLVDGDQSGTIQLLDAAALEDGQSQIMILGGEDGSEGHTIIIRQDGATNKLIIEKVQNTEVTE